MATHLQAVGNAVRSVNPATGELIREFPSATQEEVSSVVTRARSAQTAWAQTGVEKRVAVLRRFQALLNDDKSSVARLITAEAGKPSVEALTTEVLVVLDAARFCIEHAYRFLAEEPVPHGNLAMKTKSGRIQREPYGVIGIISPWNYPFSIPAVETMAALVTGNAVVLKPSEFTSLVALELVSLMHRAGVPEDLFQVIVGDGSTGAALTNSAIDKLVFTGSVNTGKRIGQAAAARLLPVLLELGGKDPMIVLDDADVDVASSGAVWGAFVNAGQTCLSVERCFVHRSIYDQFVDACVRKTQQLRLGNGTDSETDIGPMIHERQLSLVESQVDDAIAHGARVLTGGSRRADLGPNFYAPTVLTDVTSEMRIMREETFGPVLPIMSFNTDDEAIRLANDSEFGLAASIWTRSRSRGEQMARHLRAGTVMINDTVSCFGISEAPHGGVKSSGIGRTHGRYGLEEMVWTKYVDADRLPRMKKVWWYKYGAGLGRQIECMADMQFSSKWTRRIKGALGAAGILRRKDGV